MPAAGVIIGAHAILYSTDAEADRRFLRDMFQFKGVDAGEGWMIYALPPTEVAVHPHESNDEHELYLMTDDVAAEVARLRAAKVECTPPQELGWGILTSVQLPGGGSLGLYQPRHPLAHGRASAPRRPATRRTTPTARKPVRKAKAGKVGTSRGKPKLTKRRSPARAGPR